MLNNRIVKKSIIEYVISLSPKFFTCATLNLFIYYFTFKFNFHIFTKKRF